MKSTIDWFKSTYSPAGGECVETSTSLLPQGQVPVRDSKVTDGEILKFSPEAFSAFVGGVKTASF